jgi:hypothetical protein
MQAKVLFRGIREKTSCGFLDNREFSIDRGKNTADATPIKRKGQEQIPPSPN